MLWVREKGRDGIIILTGEKRWTEDIVALIRIQNFCRAHGAARSCLSQTSTLFRRSWVCIMTVGAGDADTNTRKSHAGNRWLIMTYRLKRRKNGNLQKKMDFWFIQFRWKKMDNFLYRLVAILTFICILALYWQ